ncbi:MAG: transporter substrate-binding domain-containing protein [Betaproteobacteria bacterium]
MVFERGMPMVFVVRLSLAIFTTLFLSSSAIADTLLMAYINKPPYSYSDNGVAKGFLLERSRRVMSRAGLDVRFQEMSAKRVLLEVKNNKQALCSLGWYKNAEREAYARFSVSIHEDRPHLVLVGPRSLEGVRRHGTLKSLMSDRTLVLVTSEGFSYGPELDLMITTFPGTIDSTLQPPLQLVKKMLAKRADFMFIDQEDFDYLKESNSDFGADGLVQLKYPDMPPGLKRYILCSQKVGDDVLRRINAGIAAEGKHP